MAADGFDLSLTEIVLVGVLGPLSIVNLMIGVCAMIPAQYRSLWRLLAASRSLVRRMLRCAVAASKYDPVQTRVSQRMSVKVEENMQKMWHIFAVGLAFTGLTVSINILNHVERWMSFGQTACCGSGLLLLSVGQTCLRRIFVKRPWITYNTIMFGLVLNAYFVHADLLAIFLTGSMNFFARFLASVRYLNKLWLVLIWNSLFVLVNAYTVASKIPEFTRLGIILDFWAFVTIISCSFFAARSLKEDLHREVEALILREETSGLWNLLDIVCDVVVPLDENLRFVDDAPRFTALVMAEGKNVKGMRMEDFMMTEEDQESFRRSATSACSRTDLERGPSPRVVHVRIRDSMGSGVRVELFCVQVVTLVAKNYYIGVREFSDMAPMPEFRRFEKRAARTRRCAPKREGTPPTRSAASGSLISPRDRRRDSAPHREASGSASGSEEGGSSAGSDGSGPRASSSSRGGLGGLGLASPASHPPALQTSDVALQMALVRIMRLCTGRGTGEACCPYHARVALLKTSLDALEGMACGRKFKSKGSVQCGVCGLLVDEVPQPGVHLRCFACEAEVHKPEVTPRRGLKL